MYVREEYDRRRVVPVKNSRITINWRGIGRRGLVKKSLSKELPPVRDHLVVLENDDSRPLYREGMGVLLQDEMWRVTISFFDDKRGVVRYSLVRERDMRLICMNEPDLMVWDDVHRVTVRNHYRVKHLERELEKMAEIQLDIKRALG